MFRAARACYDAAGAANRLHFIGAQPSCRLRGQSKVLPHEWRSIMRRLDVIPAIRSTVAVEGRKESREIAVAMPRRAWCPFKSSPSYSYLMLDTGGSQMLCHHASS